MEIVEYNKRKEMLSVRYNTSAIWKYSPVDVETYVKIANAESPEKLLHKTFHDSNMVGVSKEDL